MKRFFCLVLSLVLLRLNPKRPPAGGLRLSGNP